MTTIIFLILLLQFKHFLCDFVFQNEYILKNRYQYGHPGGFLHVAIHLVGTGLAFLVAANGDVGLQVLITILAAEAVVHYHIDWAKDNINRMMKLTEKDRFFWALIGLDQFLHQATYIAMVAYWMVFLP